MKNPEPQHGVLSQRSLVLLLVINLVAIAGIGLPALKSWANSKASPPSPTADILTLTATRNFTPSPRPTQIDPQASFTPTLTEMSWPIQEQGEISQGLLLLSMADNGYAHLFAYQPQVLPFTRLSGQPWDDREPTISPDGLQAAYSSRQNGYWDLFRLDLASGKRTRLTDTGAYDGSPSWSPDGKWLAFETYTGSRFQLALLDMEHLDQTTIEMRDEHVSDRSPAWAPSGRRIAFIRSDGGKSQLMITDLDQAGVKPTPIMETTSARIQHPAWSPDGKFLSWSQWEGGYQTIWISDIAAGTSRQLGSGSWPTWSPDGDFIAASLAGPNQDAMIVYRATTGTVALPAQTLPGKVSGLDWKAVQLPSSMPEAFQLSARKSPTPLWVDPGDTGAPGSTARSGIVRIEELSAPYPSLSDQADEAFRALRERAAVEAGWDYLATLDNAFLPLTSPLPPGLDNDWLYTGRAITGSSLPLQAGWLTAIKEDFTNQTYWRIYLKARYQDGSQGEPIGWNTWDLMARNSGDPQVYEEGGRLMEEIPGGYWIDLTSLAQVLGWDRLPALNNWKSFLPGARLTEFVYREGLDWESAMLQLYPKEVLDTATPAPYPFITATPIPTWFRTRTPTATVSPSFTPTRRPTWTPLPIATQGNTTPATPELDPSSTQSKDGTVQFNFPTPEPLAIYSWRPALYPVPWALGNFDHFYFSRPIAADEVNWPLTDYRYGGITPGTEVVHTGIDIDAPEDTQVLSAAGGEVVWSGYGLFSGAYDTQDPYGQAVAIRHDFGYQGNRLFTVYAHLKTSLVAKGQRVTPNEVIGQVGMTGNTTGPHLHFEVRIGENYFFNTRNPELWLAPAQGWGSLVGRVMNSDGTLLTSKEILVRSKDSGQGWVARTYGALIPNSDDYWQENLVLSDLPSGNYQISVVYYGVRHDYSTRILPGQVTYFRFQGNKLFSAQLPECISCSSIYPLDD